HRPLGDRRLPHRRDGAQARPHRRAVHDPARPAIRITMAKWGWWRRRKPGVRIAPPARERAPTVPGDDLPRTVQRDGGEQRMGFLLDLRRRGIVDRRVLRAMDQVPRENFVAPDHADAAYADQALPIDCGQTISQPYVVAYMTEQLAIGPHHRVLEIGTGSGYQAAVLSRLAPEVVRVARHRTPADTPRTRLRPLGPPKVTLEE